MCFGLPPLVREGDEIRAEFTLRNADAIAAMDVAVGRRGRGRRAARNAKTSRSRRAKRESSSGTSTAPDAVDELRYAGVDAAGRPTHRDHLKATQRVIPVVPVRTFQATLRRLEGETSEPVEAPKDAIAGKGGIRVTLAPKLTKSLDGVREWMSRYPYTCIEQRVSRAVALRDDALWQRRSRRCPRTWTAMASSSTSPP